MKYLNEEYLKKYNSNIFIKAFPYPHAVLKEIILPESYDILINNLPDIKHFEKSIGWERAYGQKSHDRYILEYDDPAVVPECWNEFIKELSTPLYHNFLSKMFCNRFFKLRFHWHYAFSGCSVSPHCDGKTKLGSQVFYLNTHQNWKQEWGGQTLVLNPKGKVSLQSNPDFDAFDVVATSGNIGNESLLFQRTDNAWHGVKELTCPEGVYRQVFILVMDLNSPFTRLNKNLKKIVNKLKTKFSF